MTALVVGVLGASGGLGTSTAAAHLAWRAARRRTVLVDASPAGGALDVHVGIDHLPGPRWSAFARLRGAADGAAVLAALPRTERYAVLAGDAGPPPPAVLGSVVRGLVADGDLVVLDLGVLVAGAEPPATTDAAAAAPGTGTTGTRHLETPNPGTATPDAVTPGMAALGTGLVAGCGGTLVAVAGLGVRHLADLERLLGQLLPGTGPRLDRSSSARAPSWGAGVRPLDAGPRVVLLTRGPARLGDLAEEVAAHVGWPLLAHWADEPRVRADLEHGIPPGARSHGLDAAADRLSALAAGHPPQEVVA